MNCFVSVNIKKPLGWQINRKDKNNLFKHINCCLSHSQTSDCSTAMLFKVQEEKPIIFPLGSLPINTLFFFFLIFWTFIYFWDTRRQSTSREGAQRDREAQNPKQAPGSEVSAEPNVGFELRTVTSWPESKSDAQPDAQLTEPPRRPTYQYS